MDIKEFIQSVKEEQNGFQFGKPWRYNKSSLTAILPILREITEERGYVTFAEANKVKIEDSGSIDTIFVTNNEDKPMFVRAGEIFKGKTQERAVVISRIVMPKQTARIKVVCIHASKPISVGAEMSRGGITPRSVENVMVMNSMESNLQSNVWSANASWAMNATSDIRAYAASSRREDLSDLMDSPIEDYAQPVVDDLVKNMETFSKQIAEVLRSVPKTPWQVGTVLLGVDGVMGFECFDLADSWTSIREDIVRKEGEELIKEDQDGVFEYKPEKAKRNTTKVLGLKFSEKDLYKDNDSQTVALELDSYIGEVTLLKDSVIHLNLTKR